MNIGSGNGNGLKNIQIIQPFNRQLIDGIVCTLHIAHTNTVYTLEVESYFETRHGFIYVHTYFVYSIGVYSDLVYLIVLEVLNGALNIRCGII